MNTTCLPPALYGLSPSDYIHPAEQKYKLSNSDAIDKGLDALSDLCVDIFKRIVLGKYIRVNAASAPREVGILKDVCRILDYPSVPSLFIRRSFDGNISAGGDKQAMILITDYIISHFDDDMLYYTFGNCVSMFKAGHIRLSSICSVMGNDPVMTPFKLPLQFYMRAADLSSDRGGLLACRNIGAALKCLLWESGMPLSELSGKTEEQLIRTANAYCEAMSNVRTDNITSIASMWKKLNIPINPPVYRIQELIDWYSAADGYKAILSRWE